MMVVRKECHVAKTYEYMYPSTAVDSSSSSECSTRPRSQLWTLMRLSIRSASEEHHSVLFASYIVW